MTQYLQQLYAFFIAAFKSLLRTPSAWVFGFIFPVIFILAFGFISGNNNTKIELGLIKDDSSLYSEIKSTISTIPGISLSESEAEEELIDKLNEGELDAILKIQKDDEILLYTNANRPENISLIKQILEQINNQLTLSKNEITSKTFTLKETSLNSREIRYIDFVLPGILGYSLISSAIFGVAFSFISLRKNLVLKRIFSTPASISAFIVGQSISRVVFITLQSIALVLVAIAVFQFSPKENLLGYFNMLVVTLVGLLVFLGFGYFVAGISKNDDVAAPIANLVVFPQFLLGGTFFAVETLPSWLTVIAKSLPLYHFNEALRNVTIEGFNFWQPEVGLPLFFLILWGILAYYLSSKTFQIK